MNRQARLPCSHDEKGAALLSVLLMVAVMSLLAVGITEVVTRSIDRAKSADVRMRLAWQTTGAEELGTALIARANEGLAGAFTDLSPGFNRAFSFEPPGGGLIELQIDDASNCFNLNSLALLGEDAEPGQLETRQTSYMDLLLALEFSQSEAEALSDAVMDWMDRDGAPRLAGAEDATYVRQRPPYRTSGQPLHDLSELKAIIGYAPEIRARLGGLVCALPTTDEIAININTLKPEEAALLSAVYSGLLGVDAARALIEQRPRGGWADVVSFETVDEIEEINPDFRRSDLLTTQSTYLQADGFAQFLDGFQTFNILYALGEGEAGVQIVRRSYGER